MARQMKKSAYQLGYEAGLDGATFDKNPFPADENGVEWNQGRTAGLARRAEHLAEDSEPDRVSAPAQMTIAQATRVVAKGSSLAMPIAADGYELARAVEAWHSEYSQELGAHMNAPGDKPLDSMSCCRGRGSPNRVTRAESLRAFSERFVEGLSNYLREV